MALNNHFSERYQKILRATIRHYIATAEPVGSKTLAAEYDLSVSSATIRNALGQLEKAGFLYQPHTSAGRIPSDSGYRVYVDQLITPDQNIAKKIDLHLSQKLNPDTWSFETLLQRAAQILATMSGYIALITMPQTSNNQLRHLQLLPISSKQVMLIIVVDTYQTQSILIDAPTISEDEELLETELQVLSNFLNSKLKGHSINELANLDWTDLDREFKQYGAFLKTLLQELNRSFQPTSSTSIMIHGISEVLRQPEFSQLQQVQMLLHLLEVEQDQLLPVIFELPELNSSASRVKILIGSENPLESMKVCTVISALYRQGKIPLGSVSIIGPTRMLYENTIPLVESAAEYLSETLS